ncbi:SPFH domain-containing protein, partial [Candidatus Gracilibacteria bacterium]|nr:SPFH domain-containing protein [Candidatus Gracilibacteria bacterium]
MGIFSFGSQKRDVIRWENPNPDLLAWKWEHEFDEIKNNSSLIVDPGLAAIFIKNGKIEAVETKSGKWSLETENTPFITSLKNILSGFESHEKASVFFLKIHEITNQKWGTPNSVTYIDPTYDFPVELRAFGNFSFKIIDLENFWTNYLGNRNQVLVDDIRMLITDRIVGNIASIFASKKISYNEIDSKTLEIAETLRDATKTDFEKLGLELVDFRIEDINFTDKTQNFIDKITDKKADVGAINASANISSDAMKNYKEIENLGIMRDAANNSGTGGDAMGAGIGMAMGMKM